MIWYAIIAGAVVAALVFGLLEWLSWWRWERLRENRRACGLEMFAGTGVRCPRPHGHRGQHLVRPSDMTAAGFAIPPF